MSLQNHLLELERRHSALEREIHKELVHPGSDETKVAEMKRRKLLLKDEIAKLRSDCSADTAKTLH
jgi:hypothetical protein